LGWELGKVLGSELALEPALEPVLDRVWVRGSEALVSVRLLVLVLELVLDPL
jgi:hypothetical protein